MKALKILKENLGILHEISKSLQNTEVLLDIKEIEQAITELEALQPRSCKGCKAFNGVEDGIILCFKFHYIKTGYDFNDAHFCCNRYEPKGK